VELNQRERTIKVKIVYYGPPLGGKTTNIAKLHEAAHASHRGDMTSVNSAQDRTILFDLLPLKTSGFRGFDLKIQLVAVPGQPIYALTRRVVLKAVDGLVFVANSAVDRWEDNIQSQKEMLRNLVMADYQVDPRTIPFVLQYNKRDLPNVMPVESLDRALNQRRVEPILAVASRGEGVLETFAAILSATMQDILRRYRAIEMSPGLSAKEWAERAVDSMFDKTLLMPREDVRPPPAHRKVSIVMPDDAPAVSPSGPTSRMQETLVESYAEASIELGELAAWLRDERDLARSRLEQVASALTVADEIGRGTNVVADLVRALGILGEAGGTLHSSFLLPAPAASFRAVLRPPLAEDPLLKSSLGLRSLETLRGAEEPSLARASETPDLEAAFATAEPRFVATAIVPIRGADTLLGLVVLYYLPDTALPSIETLSHLRLLARIFRMSLELAAALGAL
jgi:mutual gliding-motility protein MglA